MLYNILDLYFPEKEKGFDSTFLLQVLGGKKKYVNSIYNRNNINQNIMQRQNLLQNNENVIRINLERQNVNYESNIELESE